MYCITTHTTDGDVGGNDLFLKKEIPLFYESYCITHTSLHFLMLLPCAIERYNKIKSELSLRPTLRSDPTVHSLFVLFHLFFFQPSLSIIAN
jgi:hypothetical protein